MAIEEFTGQLDQERQPQAAQVTGAPRVEEFTGELDKETTKNPLMGGLARILDLGASGAEAIQRSTAGLRKGLEEGTPEALRSKFLSDEAVRQRQEAFTSSARQMSKDIGYEPSTSLADLGDNPVKVVPFVIERVITSSPDMAGAALAFTPYVMTRANEILNDRLKNDGKSYEQATVGDVAAATAGAIGEATLERFATKRILPGGKGVAAAPAAGIPAALKRVGKEVGVQGGTESLEELASYGGETIGTKKGFQPGEAGERMLEAGIVGAGLGGGTRGAREVYDYAKQPKVEELPPDAKIDPIVDTPPTKGQVKSLDEEIDKALAEGDTSRAEYLRGMREKMFAERNKPIVGKEPWEEILGPTPPVEKAPVEVAPIEKPPLAPIIPIEEGKKGSKIEGVEEIKIDPSELKLSEDVPQFKEDADVMGVVEPLKGSKYDYVGTPPIQVWRRLDGSLEIISGRHRWDLAKRTNAEYIPAQVFDEAKGFNADMAAIMDAELNIRDGKGKVTDYVNYFTEAGNRFGLTKTDYENRGLLDSSKGKRAYAITVQGSDDLIQSLRGRQVTEDTAYRIADAVPNDPRLQALGLKLVNEKPLEQAISILKAAKTIEPKQTEGGGEFDLFGFDDSAMKLAEDMGKLALKKQRELSDDILAIKPAAKRADKAAKGGVKVANPEKVLAEAKRLEELRSRWDNWASDPELVDQIRREISGEVVETAPAEAKPSAKDAEEKKIFDGAVTKFYSAAVRHRKAAELHYSKLGGKKQAAFEKIFNGIQDQYEKIGYNSNDSYRLTDDAYNEAMARLYAEEFNDQQQRETNGRLSVKRFGPRDYKLYEDGKEIASGSFDDVHLAAWEKRAEYQEGEFKKGSVAEKPEKKAAEKAVKIVKTEPAKWAGEGFGTKGASYGVEGNPDIMIRRESHGWTAFNKKTNESRFGENKSELEKELADNPFKPKVEEKTTEEAVGKELFSFELKPEEKQTSAEKKAATERENKKIADREAEFFTLTPRTPEQGAGDYLQQDMIGAMGLTETEFKKGIDKKSTEPGEPLILRDVTMSEQETYNDEANAKVDDEIIDLFDNMANVKDVEVEEDVSKTLNKQAQAVEDYINLASQGKVTAEEFMKTVREAAAKGEITPDVFNAIEHIYKTSPAVLDGIRIEMSGGKKRTGKYLEIGHYQPLARMIRLFKDTSGVSDPATVRHEIAHTMEQMMTPEQKRMVIRAWRDELMRATRAETTDEGHIFFQNVAKFLHDPKLSTYKAVIKSMPNESYYQYVNPSEYWAVNAEEILRSREAGKSGLKSMVEKLHEGLKQSFGMSNFWVGNKVFNQILTGDRFSPRMLINYVRATQHRNYAGNKAPLATWDIMGSNWLEDWKYNYVDKNIDLKRVQEDISRMTGDVADEIDPHARESLSHGRIAERMAEFVLNYVNKLAVVMKDNNISQQQLHEYLLARHAPEYNRVVGGRNPTMGDMASSISTKEAQDYIRSLGAARVEELNKAAQIIDAMTQKTRDILVDEGYEDASTIEAWEKQFQFYVPFLRKDIEYKGGGSGFGSSKGRGKFSQMAAGSLKEVDDIGKNVVMEHLRAIEKVEDARVRRALFGLAVKNPNPDFWMPIDPSAMKNPEKTAQILKNMGLSEELIKNLMQPPKAPKMNEQTGLVEYVTSDVISKSKNVVAVRIDGHQVYLVLNGSNPRANRLAQSIQNMDTKSLEGYLRASAYVTRWFAQVNTQWNPIFGLWNFARDIQGAGLNLSTTQLRGHEKEVLKGAFPAARQIFMALRAQRRTGKLATTPGASEFYNLGLAGGKTGFKAKFVDPSREKNLLQEAVKDLDRGKPMKIAKYLSDAISDWNDMLENAVRLSAYKVALANGLSEQQAATIAKNLTVNFNRKGAKSQNLGALFAFFNASVQGTARLYETLKGPIGLKITYGGIMLGLLQSGMMALAGFEDDEPPDFVKEKNIIIPLGWITGEKNYINVPMPLGFNVFPGVGRLMGETLIGAARGDDVGHKFFDVISLIANSFNPLGSTGLSLQTIAPTPLDPFVALSQNKDAFGRPIYKADRDTNPQVGYKRTRETTWEGWKAIAEFINYAQGGTQDTRGAFKALDLTGDEISFLVGQATGGLGRDVMKTFGMAKDFVTGDETPTYKIPLIGKLYGNAESQAAERNRFYTNVTKLAELEARVKGMRERKENVAEFRREHPETQVMAMANRIENEITQLNKRRNNLIKNGATVEQIKRVEEIKQRKMQQLNDRYNMLRKQ